MRNYARAEQIGLREESIERRAKHRQSAPEILAEHGVSFISRNSGAHLIVEHGGVTFDFWPGTGKFTQRGITKSGRGIFNLLKLLEVRHVQA
jgi:hypothetical protein